MKALLLAALLAGPAAAARPALMARRSPEARAASDVVLAEDLQRAGDNLSKLLDYGDPPAGSPLAAPEGEAKAWFDRALAEESAAAAALIDEAGAALKRGIRQRPRRTEFETAPPYFFLNVSPPWRHKKAPPERSAIAVAAVRGNLAGQLGALIFWKTENPPVPKHEADAAGYVASARKDLAAAEARAALKDPEVGDLQEALLKSPGCEKNDADAKELAPELKDRYRLVSCESRAGLKVVLLGPKETIPGRQLEFGDIKDGKTTVALRGARFFGHYLVLEFEDQTQYLDLLKPDPELGGFRRAGFVSQGTATRFEDAEPFADALRNYMGIGESDDDFAAGDDVSERLPGLVGGQPYRLTGSINGRGELIVVAKTGGRSIKLWPTSVRRVRK